MNTGEMDHEKNTLITCSCLHHLCINCMRLKQFRFRKRKEKLIMGTSADYKPFEYKEGDDIVGFDVELAKALAKKAGYEIEAGYGLQQLNYSAEIKTGGSRSVRNDTDA